MLDFYGLPEDFPGKENMQGSGDPYKDVEYLEKCFQDTMQHSRFIPFLALHEFEAWVFSSPKAVSEHFGCVRLEKALEEIVQQAGSPELINQGVHTHPKARLMDLVVHSTGNKRAYGAKTDGPVILEKTLIKVIRKKCQHFNDWLTRLESLGAAKE